MNDATSGKTLIIDDHPLFRKGVSQLIAMDERLRLVGEASSGEQGIQLATTLDPDLILLDLNMKGMGGIATLQALRDAGVAARIVILTVSDAADDLVARQSEFAGVGDTEAALRREHEEAAERLAVAAEELDGYLLKEMEPDDLLARIGEALYGRMVISDSLNGLLAHALRDEAQTDARRQAPLTQRERTILTCLANGLSNKLIARELDIAEGTVKVHIKNLLKKLKFRSRLEAAVWAIDEGIRG